MPPIGYTGQADALAIMTHIRNNNYYTNDLMNLGLTHVVTNYDNVTSSSIYKDKNLRIMDANFEWGNYFIPGAMLHSNYLLWAQGNDTQYSYEVGGTYSKDMKETNNFGFGSGANTSVWTMQREFRDPTFKYAGESMNMNSGRRVQACFVDNPKRGSNDNMIIAEGNLFHHHFTNSMPLRFFLTLKAGKYYPPKGLSKVPVMTITFYTTPIAEEKGNLAETSSKFNSMANSAYQSSLKSGNVFTGDSIPCQYVIYNDQLNSDSLNFYKFYTNYFTKRTRDMINLNFTVQWSGYCDLAIDNCGFVNDAYDEIYNTQNGTNTLRNLYITQYNSSGLNKSNLENMYVDEPPILSLRVRTTATEMFHDTKILNNDTMYEVNGTQAMWGGRAYGEFSRKYGKTQSGFFRSYYLDDSYQIFGSARPDNQEKVQECLDNRVIMKDWITEHFEPRNLLYGAELEPLYYGIAQSFWTTRNYRTNFYIPDTTDIFYVSGIQEQGEIHVQDGKIPSGYPTKDLRTPTRDEIMVQGMMSIAWGAKGFYHYHLSTRAHKSVSGDTSKYWNVYGLFDDPTKRYNDDDTLHIQNPFQDPTAPMSPNNRFFYTKRLIDSVKVIESELLKTYLVGAVSWGKRTDPYLMQFNTYADYVKSVVTKANSNQTDMPTNTYVELGYYKSFNPTTNTLNPDTSYVFLVNRRVNKNGADSSYRWVNVVLNEAKFPYQNYKIIDVSYKDTTYHSITDTLKYFVGPGCGRLIKIIPVVKVGGPLYYNETIKTGTTVECLGSLTVKNGVTLKVEGGAQIKLNNTSKITGEAGSIIRLEGTSSTNRAKLDFKVKDWSNYNGLWSTDGTVILKNAEICNAYIGVYSYHPVKTYIDSSFIHDCWFGASLYSSDYSGTEKDTIKNSTFNMMGYRGIIVNNGCSALFLDNAINNCSQTGIYVQLGGTPRLSQNIGHRGNVIAYNDYGIYSINSTPVINQSDSTSKNTILANRIKNLSVNETSEATYPAKKIYARYVYWGSTTPSQFLLETNQDSIVYTPYLTSLPQTAMSRGISYVKSGLSDLENPIITTKSSLDSLMSMLRFGQNLLDNNEIARGRAVVLSLIMESNPLVVTREAIQTLKRCYDRRSYDSYISKLQEIRNISTLRNMANLELVTADYDHRDVYMKELLGGTSKSNTGSEEEITALYLMYKETKFNHGENVDSTVVANIVERMKSEYPNHYLTQDVEMELGKAPDEGLNKNKGMGINTSPVETVYEYSLSEGYPNPFNPSTKVNYSLKEQSKVNIKIYSITGSLIKELVNTENTKGNHEVIWNGDNGSGSKVSSGIYILQLNAKSTESGSAYTKSIKLVMIK